MSDAKSKEKEHEHLFKDFIPKDGLYGATYDDLTNFIKAYHADTPDAAKKRKTVERLSRSRQKALLKKRDEFLEDKLKGHIEGVGKDTKDYLLNAKEADKLLHEIGKEALRQKHGKEHADHASHQQIIEYINERLGGGRDIYNQLKRSLTENPDYIQSDEFTKAIAQLYHVHEARDLEIAKNELKNNTDHHKKIKGDVHKHLKDKKINWELKESADIGLLVDEFLPEIYHKGISHETLQGHVAQFAKTPEYKIESKLKKPDTKKSLYEDAKKGHH